MDLTNILFQEAVNVQLLEAGDTALAVAKYPASGSFIDVREYKRFGFLIGKGALDTATTFQVEQATAINGTPKDVADAVHIAAGDSDDKFAIIEVDGAKLDINNDYHFVTLDVTGPTGNDYSCIWFFGFGKKVPVTNGSDEDELVAVVG